MLETPRPKLKTSRRSPKHLSIDLSRNPAALKRVLHLPVATLHAGPHHFRNPTHSGNQPKSPTASRALVKWASSAKQSVSPTRKVHLFVPRSGENPPPEPAIVAPPTKQMRFFYKFVDEKSADNQQRTTVGSGDSASSQNRLNLFARSIQQRLRLKHRPKNPETKSSKHEGILKPGHFMK